MCRQQNNKIRSVKADRKQKAILPDFLLSNGVDI